MKLKKKVKLLLLIILLILLAVISIFIYKTYFVKEEVKGAKIVSKIETYGYNLKENKPEKYKKLFEELKAVLNEEEVKDEEYVNILAEMFIYDFYSLKDKDAKTDVGGVEFVHKDIETNFLQNAQNTYYKYIENNIYKNRKQNLPEVDEVVIESVNKEKFTYNGKTDEEAYNVKVSWTYTENEFSNYQQTANLIFVHEDKKLFLVELQ